MMAAYRKNIKKYRNLIYLIGTPAVFCAFTILLMTIYWLTNCISVAITALIPTILFPLFGILPSQSVVQAYFEDVVMMFIGSLILSSAIELTKIHEHPI
ncbi:solute carrier family 13 member 5-like [Brachionus plicatilis]|uniref:Solute carrier family 13 member 5-like n=1 Tax=Brachionus plicatilis TaxID=10195 RepID=A0A3M7S4E6_BRAPC|nr:solute carrier family 13 member 5-like [Brachionus plicatilis]